MTTRIYRVVGPSGTKLVEAGSQSAAINHVVRSDYKATPASAKDVAYSGLKVEKAGPEPKAEPEADVTGPALTDLPPTKGKS